uniref:uncharacterized protein LOC113475739 n=1 Tax=Ciona intestinalis TaxID=7719 RepID=UPI000EF4BF93
MEEDQLENKIRSLFIKIGAARVNGIVHVFCFSKEKQWIAYTSKDYKLPSNIPFHEGHFWINFPKGNRTDRTDACVQITTYASDESMNSVEDFWKGNVPYTSKSGLVATLLTDTFRPTPELQKGFAYNVKLSDTKHFTIRGHERNIEAQYRTIQESVKNLQSLCEQSRTSITTFQKQCSSHYKDITLSVKNMDEMFGKITNSDMQKCLEQIEEVQTSAENQTRAWENGSDEFEQTPTLKENVELLKQKFDSFGRPDIVKFGIDSVERHIDKLNKTVADFKNTVLVKCGFGEANNCVEIFRNFGHTFQSSISNREINSAKGKIARVYLEEQLMVNEEIPYYCTQLLLSSPFCNVEKLHDLVTFLSQAIIHFKQMTEFIPDEMKIMSSLNTTYQHLQCHKNYPIPRDSMIKFLDNKSQLGQQGVHLFERWFNKIASMKTAMSMQSYTAEHLQSAIIHAQVLDQFYKASDRTTVRENGIHFHFQLLEDNEKMLKHDEQLYLVITSSIISLCQSKQTKSKTFISLLRFAAKHWNVRRWFGPLKRENKQQTCLKSLASFCNTTQSAIAKAEKQCDEKSELAENLNQLNTKIAAMKTTLDETEGKFQDMFSELRIPQQEEAEDIDDVSASLENQAVSDTETLPKLTLEKVNEFVEAIRDLTGPIVEIK